jgi:hypothetical protein
MKTSMPKPTKLKELMEKLRPKEKLKSLMKEEEETRK